MPLQATNNPTWPVHTFQVNTNTPMLYSWDMPVTAQTPPGDCGGYNEQAALPYTRSTWLATLLPGFMNIRGMGANPSINPTLRPWPVPTIFTLYGQQATYVKNTYITGSPDDPLILLS